MNAVSVTRESSDALQRKIISVFPAAAAMVYPFLLQAFHVAVSPSGGSLSAVRIAGAAILLGLAFAVPLSDTAFPDTDLRTNATAIFLL